MQYLCVLYVYTVKQIVKNTLMKNIYHVHFRCADMHLFIVSLMTSTENTTGCLPFVEVTLSYLVQSTKWVQYTYHLQIVKRQRKYNLGSLLFTILVTSPVADSSKYSMFAVLYLPSLYDEWHPSFSASKQTYNYRVVLSCAVKDGYWPTTMM